MKHQTMIRAIAAIALMLLLISHVVFPRSASASDKYYLFKTYNTQNGLINNVIYSIAQDRQGFVWLGSDMGLSRFDGKTFYHKAVPNIYNHSVFVPEIMTTGKGHIVCTAFMQGAFEQLDNGRFRNYHTSPDIINENSLYSVVRYPDNQLLFGSSSALFLTAGDSLLQIYDYGTDKAIFTTLAMDENNTIWFGGANGLGFMMQVGSPNPSGSLDLPGSHFSPIYIPELKDLYIVKILFDESGVLHVASARGYYRIEFDEPFRPGSKYRINQSLPDLSTLYINNVYIDREQNLWIATSSKGAFRVKGDSITLNLNTDNGLPSSSVFCVMQDRDGGYWFGTNNGLSMVNNFDSYAIAKDGKLFQQYYDMTVDRFDRIWIADQFAFHVYQDGCLMPLDIKNTPLEKEGIDNLIIDNKSVMWIYNDSELFRMPLTENMPELRNAKKVADFSAYNPMGINSATADENGIWLCARNKILLYHTNRILPVLFNHPDSMEMEPQSLIKDHFGYYWICSHKNGLYRASLVEKSENAVVFDHILAYKSTHTDSTFATTWNQELIIDKEGNLWQAAMYTGVYKHTIDSTGIVLSKLYSLKNGLSSNMATGLCCAEDGRIWIQTQNGTCILTQDRDGEEQFLYLNKKDGVAGQPITTVEQEDRIFTLTDEGLFVTQNKQNKDTITNAPKVFITGLLINGIDYTASIYRNKTLKLGHYHNNLTFEFSSIAFNRSDNVIYQYLLDGINDSWSFLSDRNVVEYPALAPGKYKFKVRAVTDNGAIGDETSFTFKIRPAYYQSYWFYLLIAIVLSILLYSFYKYRIRQVIKIEHMRSRIAADLHDDIGSTLSSIFLMSEMTGSSDKQFRLVEVLRKISENSRDILNSMDDIIWSVKPQDDLLSNLIVRLREYAIPLCEAKGISLYMNMEETVAGLKLEMDERRNVYLITKEAMNNAIKHSGSNALEVTFTIVHKQIEVIINDNGCGFDVQSPTSRNGLVNMHQRAKQINRELIVRSEKGRGTTIRLKNKNHMFI